MKRRVTFSIEPHSTRPWPQMVNVFVDGVFAASIVGDADEETAIRIVSDVTKGPIVSDESLPPFTFIKMKFNL